MSNNEVLNVCTVLIFAPLGRDAQYTQILLSQSGIRSRVANSIPSLVNAITDDTGAILLTSEAIAREETGALVAKIDAQPSWSDIPFLYLAPARQKSSSAKQTTIYNFLPERISNVMVLERPLSRESLISAVNWALAARVRQFVIRDQLDELSRAAEQLRISNERVDLALKSGAILGTWVWDVPHNLVTGDERFANTFGIAVDAIKHGIPLDAYIQVVHPEDTAYLGEKIAQTLKMGGAYKAEYRIRNADGHWRWVEANGNCELNADGEPVRFPGVLIDIDERKKSAESLKQSEGELRLVTDSLPVLIAFIDTEHRIQFVNKASDIWFYQASSALIGKLIDELLIQRTGCTSIESIVNALAGEAIHCERAWPHANGKRREAEIRFLPRFTMDGAVDGFHFFVMDITDRKVAEEVFHQSQTILEERVAERTLELKTAMEERKVVEDALRQSQKMEAVGQLTGGIAHDFNNLLQGITGSLNVIKKALELGKSLDIERYIDNALTASFRAAGLTHRLLAFSRRQPLDPKPTQVNPLIHSMEDMLKRTLGENIVFALDLDPNLWETLCDVNQLESAILNLAINARDAMPDGGLLKIHTRNVSEKKFASNQDGEFVKISVSDTGTGMTPDVIERAFDPFYTTKPQGQGTGLGLSMIYGFTRQSEGYSKIESTPGAGTTVHLYLPRSEGQHETVPATEDNKSPTPVNADGRVILVVEDDEIVRGLVADSLKELGFRILQAEDGPSGLEILKSNVSIDLLVTDIGLPGLNGRQIADAALVDRRDLKVLFMTGYAETAASSTGFLRDGMAMITKPFKMEALTQKVNQLI